MIKLYFNLNYLTSVFVHLADLICDVVKVATMIVLTVEYLSLKYHFFRNWNAGYIKIRMYGYIKETMINRRIESVPKRWRTKKEDMAKFLPNPDPDPEIMPMFRPIHIWYILDLTDELWCCDILNMKYRIDLGCQITSIFNYVLATYR